MQFDVHENTGASRGHAPYLVDIQANLLSGLATRLVVPLVPEPRFGPRLTRLHPVLHVLESDFVLAAQLVAAIDRRRLGQAVASVLSCRDEIVAAVDVLLAGV